MEITLRVLLGLVLLLGIACASESRLTMHCPKVALSAGASDALTVDYAFPSDAALTGRRVELTLSNDGIVEIGSSGTVPTKSTSNDGSVTYSFSIDGSASNGTLSVTLAGKSAGSVTVSAVANYLRVGQSGLYSDTASSCSVVVSP